MPSLKKNHAINENKILDYNFTLYETYLTHFNIEHWNFTLSTWKTFVNSLAEPEPNALQDEEEQVDDVHVEDEGSEDIVLGAEWVLVFAANYQLRVDHDKEAEKNARSSQLSIKENSHGLWQKNAEWPEDDAADAGVDEVGRSYGGRDGGDHSVDEETDQGRHQTSLIKSFKTDPRQNAVRKQTLIN